VFRASVRMLFSGCSPQLCRDKILLSTKRSKGRVTTLLSRRKSDGVQKETQQSHLLGQTGWRAAGQEKT